MTPAGKTPQRRLGDWGERIAATHLQAQGMVITARNWHWVGGEIDLIALDGAELVFVEVKTRRGERFGTPEAALTPTKQARLISGAQQYLLENDIESDEWRIDLVAVALDSQGKLLRCTHWPGIVGAWQP